MLSEETINPKPMIKIQWMIMTTTNTGSKFITPELEIINKGIKKIIDNKKLKRLLNIDEILTNSLGKAACFNKDEQAVKE